MHKLSGIKNKDLDHGFPEPSREENIYSSGDAEKQMSDLISPCRMAKASKEKREEEGIAGGAKLLQYEGGIEREREITKALTSQGCWCWCRMCGALIFSDKR